MMEPIEEAEVEDDPIQQQTDYIMEVWNSIEDLSRKITNVERDLADGRLVAEFIHKFLPSHVRLDQYESAADASNEDEAQEIKMRNWVHLNMFVFRELGLNVPIDWLLAITKEQPGQVQLLTAHVQTAITREYERMIDGAADTEAEQAAADDAVERAMRNDDEYDDDDNNNNDDDEYDVETLEVEFGGNEDEDEDDDDEDDEDEDDEEAGLTDAERRALNRMMDVFVAQQRRSMSMYLERFAEEVQAQQRRVLKEEMQSRERELVQMKDRPAAEQEAAFALSQRELTKLADLMEEEFYRHRDELASKMESKLISKVLQERRHLLNEILAQRSAAEQDALAEQRRSQLNEVEDQLDDDNYDDDEYDDGDGGNVHYGLHHTRNTSNALDEDAAAIAAARSRSGTTVHRLRKGEQSPSKLDLTDPNVVRRLAEKEERRMPAMIGLEEHEVSMYDDDDNNNANDGDSKDDGKKGGEKKRRKKAKRFATTAPAAKSSSSPSTAAPASPDERMPKFLGNDSYGFTAPAATSSKSSKRRSSKRRKGKQKNNKRSSAAAAAARASDDDHKHGGGDDNNTCHRLMRSWSSFIYAHPELAASPSKKQKRKPASKARRRKGKSTKAHPSASAASASASSASASGGQLNRMPSMMFGSPSVDNLVAAATAAATASMHTNTFGGKKRVKTTPPRHAPYQTTPLRKSPSRGGGLAWTIEMAGAKNLNAAPESIRASLTGAGASSSGPAATAAAAAASGDRHRPFSWSIPMPTTASAGVPSAANRVRSAGKTRPKRKSTEPPSASPSAIASAIAAASAVAESSGSHRSEASMRATVQRAIKLFGGALTSLEGDVKELRAALAILQGVNTNGAKRKRDKKSSSSRSRSAGRYARVSMGRHTSTDSSTSLPKAKVKRAKVSPPPHSRGARQRVNVTPIDNVLGSPSQPSLLYTKVSKAPKRKHDANEDGHTAKRHADAIGVKRTQQQRRQEEEREAAERKHNAEEVTASPFARPGSSGGGRRSRKSKTTINSSLVGSASSSSLARLRKKKSKKGSSAGRFDVRATMGSASAGVTNSGTGPVAAIHVPVPGWLREEIKQHHSPRPQDSGDNGGHGVTAASSAKKKRSSVKKRRRPLSASKRRSTPSSPSSTSSKGKKKASSSKAKRSLSATKSRRRRSSSSASATKSKPSNGIRSRTPQVRKTKLKKKKKRSTPPPPRRAGASLDSAPPVAAVLNAEIDATLRDFEQHMRLHD